MSALETLIKRAEMEIETISAEIGRVRAEDMRLRALEDDIRTALPIETALSGENPEMSLCLGPFIARKVNEQKQIAAFRTRTSEQLRLLSLALSSAFEASEKLKSVLNQRDRARTEALLKAEQAMLDEAALQGFVRNG